MDKELPVLTDVEIRVLGALMEKSKTTPDYYPMTLNSLAAACNQKTSRFPVVEYSEETISAALRSLKGQNLISHAIGGSSRTTKFKHNFDIVFQVTEGEFAILCLLFLRGPQTPGELNTNSGRIYEFQSLGTVHEILNRLAEAQPPYVKELPKRPGQKETRYVHLFGEHIPLEDSSSVSDEIVRKPAHELEVRLAAVERELAEVRETLAKLMKELMG
jgi:uncharacterized protein